MARKLKGIRRHGRGWQVFLRVNGRFVQEKFDLDTPVEEMRAWQEKQRGTVAPPTKGTLAAKAVEYFAKPEIAAQAYVDHKKRHLELWLDRLGWETPIGAISRDQIEAVLQDWLRTFAPATVYHRRSSLLSVFAHAYGDDAPNVVLGTTVPLAWTPRDQSVDFATLQKILDAMPTERIVNKGIRQPSTARLVSAVLMHTGVRGCDLVQVRRPHINWQRGICTMPPTKKAKGGEWWPCVLTPEALAAMRAFDQANLYGAFDPAAVSHSYKRAARRVLGRETDVHLYSMRHSVGAEILHAGGDTATVGRMLGHAPGSRMSEQYSKGAHAEVDRRAMEAMAAARRAAIAEPAGKELPEKLPAKRKPRKRSKLRRVS